MMGDTDAQVKMPKPSGDLAALLKPIPVDRTKGTVTGPVVTPAATIVEQKERLEDQVRK